MRRATLLVAAVLVFALAATSVAAMTIIFDRYDRVRNEGVCLAQTGPGVYWLIHYRDGREGTPGHFDMTDVTLSRERVRMRR